MTKEQEHLFLKYFRITLFLLAVALNTICYMVGISYSWVIFLSGILLYMIDGEMKDRLLRVVCGGTVGICCAAILLILITVLTPIIGRFLGYVLPLSAVIFPLIVLQPKAPHFLNNVAFAYLCCACISAADFYAHFVQILITFLVGSLVYNGIALILMRVCIRCAVQKKPVVLQEASMEGQKDET